MRQENTQETERDVRLSRWLYESAMTHAERSNRRFFILTIILVILLLITNIGWIVYENQFEVVERTYAEIEQQADGDSNNYNYIIGGDYGSESEDQSD